VNAMALTSSVAMTALLSTELLRDARADYSMCIASGLIDASPEGWQMFVAGYVDQAAFYTAVAPRFNFAVTNSPAST